MPLGVDDSWWDVGFVTHLIVETPDLDALAAQFGTPARWWPRTIEGIPDEWWLRFPRFGVERDAALKRIAAYAAKEPGLNWSVVTARASNCEPDAEDDDYHRPLYEDAVAALELRSPEGPELYESPVRVGVRLSRALGTRAAAFWGSDEEPGLGGVCLIHDGQLVWAASVHPRAAVSACFEAYRQGQAPDEEDGHEDACYEQFFLYEAERDEQCVAENLQAWTDARFREIGAGVHWGVSLLDNHPYDFPQPLGEFVEEMVIAIGE